MKNQPAEIDLSIVVPIFNEEESVANLLREIGVVFDGQPRGAKWELILVNDGSRDRTYDLASTASQELNMRSQRSHCNATLDKRPRCRPGSTQPKVG